MSKSNKTAKKTTSKTVAKTAKKTAVKSVKVSTIAPTTKISFLKARPKGAGGPKTELLNLVPKTGSIAFAKLVKKAEAAELNVKRVPKWLTMMAKNGRVSIAA